MSSVIVIVINLADMPILGVLSSLIYPICFTGELTLASALDYETTDHYSLTVMASDAGGLSDFKSLEISVTDVNDNVPVIELVRYEVSYLFLFFTLKQFPSHSSLQSF